jgi:two-component system, OmpR family, sensor histidine kinase ChvG
MKILRSQWLSEQSARIGGKLGEKFQQVSNLFGNALVEKLQALKKTRVKRILFYGWRRLSPLARYFKLNFKFNSLTRRILVYNMFGLIILLGGVMILNQYRAGLIEVRVQNLLTQGKIIAEAIAASSSIDADQVIVDPEELLEMQSDHDALGSIDSYDSLEFPINPERAAPILLRLIAPTGTRARIYDHEGIKLLDSKALNDRGQITREDLPPTGIQKISYPTRFMRWLKRIWRGNIPLYTDIGSANGKGYEEVRSALMGLPKNMSRLNERSELIVSVAVPIQRMRAVLGVLMLSTRGDDIDKIVKDEMNGIMRVGLIAATVLAALSMWLSNQIGAPMRKLAAAARRVRHSAKAREEIPDFTDRNDEIGELSGSLRDMTKALYSRIEAIETFAADVAHELKNPLTSLKSAVETLPLVQKEELRERLTNIILHDVKRLDRLISDISDASRLDAELAREEFEPLDISTLLETIIPAFDDVHREIEVNVLLVLNTVARCPDAFLINGHDMRIGQVINNLVDNAISFSPNKSKVSVKVRRIDWDIEIRIEDEGPGIPPDNLEKIFKRFYTDRPEEQGFGNNSGLGLNISEQIIMAHKGKIWAENLMENDKIIGACFVIQLPAIVGCD